MKISQSSYAGESETIDFYVDKKKYNTRARSHRYMDEDDESETDTTYYDDQYNMLDIGYQHLRVINLRLYPEYYNITKMYVDNNKLKSLPDASYLPNLKKLNCSHNQLHFVPFYPKLRVLIANNNMVLNFSVYNKSPLKFFDCSHNNGINIDLYLPYCTRLFATNCSLTQIDLAYFPSLLYLDCEYNRLSKIQQSNILVELCINSNNLTDLPFYPNLTKLFANDNKLRRIITYPLVDIMHVKNNHLYVIDDQPSLKRLHASFNRLENIGHFPIVKYLDLSHNCLQTITINRYVEEAFVHSNPIQDLRLDQSSLKEFHLDFDIYQQMMKHQVLEYVDLALVHNSKILHKLFEDVDNEAISKNMVEKISKKMSEINFAERDLSLYTLSVCLYRKIGGSDISDLNNNKTFLRIFDVIKKMYLKSLVVVCYYRGYDKQN